MMSVTGLDFALYPLLVVMMVDPTAREMEEAQRVRSFLPIAHTFMREGQSIWIMLRRCPLFALACDDVGS